MSRAYFVFDGVAYNWSGWFGCQLESLEWRRAPAGTERVLNILPWKQIRVTVHTTEREGLKVRHTWSVSKRGTHEEYTARINELRNALMGMV